LTATKEGKRQKPDASIVQRALGETR